jgi:hypothetical protein
VLDMMITNRKVGEADAEPRERRRHRSRGWRPATSKGCWPNGAKSYVIAEVRYQSRNQRRTIGQRVDLDMLVQCVRAVADRTKAV